MKKLLLTILTTGILLFSSNQVFAGHRVQIIDDTNGSRLLASIPDCSNASTEKLIYVQATREFKCETDGGGVGSGDFMADGSVPMTDALPLFSDAAPTTSVVGEIAFDNNAWASGRGALQSYDGTSNVYLVGCSAADVPGDGEVCKWNTGGLPTWEVDLNTAGITAADTCVLFSDGADNPSCDTANFNYNKITGALSATSFIAAPSATPTISAIDSDTNDKDVSTQIVTDCTDTGSGTEDCDMTFSQQIAGNMTAFFTADADGNTAIRSIGAGSYAAAGIDGDDLASSLGGRSITLTPGSPDVFDADAELYTVTKCAVIETPTSADNFMILHIELGAQVTRVHCIVEDATSATIEMEQCDVAGDNCTIITTALVCDVGGQEDDGTIDSPDLDVDDWVRMDVTATNGTPGAVTGCVTMTMDD